MPVCCLLFFSWKPPPEPQRRLNNSFPWLSGSPRDQLTDFSGFKKKNVYQEKLQKWDFKSCAHHMNHLSLGGFMLKLEIHEGLNLKIFVHDAHQVSQMVIKMYFQSSWDIWGKKIGRDSVKD